MLRHVAPRAFVGGMRCADNALISDTCYAAMRVPDQSLSASIRKCRGIR